MDTESDTFTADMPQKMQLGDYVVDYTFSMASNNSSSDFVQVMMNNYSVLIRPKSLSMHLWCVILCPKTPIIISGLWRFDNWWELQRQHDLYSTTTSRVDNINNLLHRIHISVLRRPRRQSVCDFGGVSSSKNENAHKSLYRKPGDRRCSSHCFLCTCDANE